MPSDTKVVTRIYANVKGLAEVCFKAGLVESSYHIEDFARGFTKGKTLFDMIDVSYGKDRADNKLTGKLDLPQTLQATTAFCQLTKGRTFQATSS